MSKLKLIFVVLLVVLIGFVFFLYNTFNGNPVSKMISKKVLENYLEETYPDQEFRINEGYYNFKSSNYDYEVIEMGAADKEGNVMEYEFYISGFFKPTVSWDGIYYENLDEQLASRLSEEAQQEISQLLSPKIDTLYLVDIGIEVLEGTFEDDIKWSQELPLDKPIEIFIQFDSSEQTKEDFFSAAKKAKSLIDKQQYKYKFVVFNGSGFEKQGVDEYLKYYLRVEPDEVVKMKAIEEANRDMW